MTVTTGHGGNAFSHSLLVISIATGSMLKNAPKTSNFVIPAKAGIQNVDEVINFNSWTPTFAGVTSHVSTAC
jgi:hypothetical protein